MTRKPSFQERIDRCGRIFASTLPSATKVADGSEKAASRPPSPKK